MRQILFCVTHSAEEHGNQKLQVSNKTFRVFSISAFRRAKHGYHNLRGFAHSAFCVLHCGKRKSNSIAFGHLEDLGTDLDKLWAFFCSQLSIFLWISSGFHFGQRFLELLVGLSLIIKKLSNQGLLTGNP